MEAVDKYITSQTRQLDKLFLMPIEDVFSILGTIKVGEDVEVLSVMQGAPQKTTVTGVEMFKKSLNCGEARDHVGLLLRSLKRDDVQRGQVW